LFVEWRAHLEDASQSNKKHEKVVQTKFGVKETIRSFRSTKPCALKDIIGAQMLAQNVSDFVFEILNEYGVAPGKGVIVKTDKGIINMKLSEGLTNITWMIHICSLLTTMTTWVSSNVVDALGINSIPSKFMWLSHGKN
jgi:hypothetical protein